MCVCGAAAPVIAATSPAHTASFRHPAWRPDCSALSILPETEDGLILELELPFWIDPEDVAVEFGERQLALTVRNTAHVRRTYWRNRCGRRAAVPATVH